MSRKKMPVTSAIRVLRKHEVEFTEHVYTYREHGGAQQAAQEIGVDELAAVKTLIMRDQRTRGRRKWSM